MPPSPRQHLQVSPQEAQQRLDIFLVARLGWSRGKVKRLLDAGLVRLDGRTERRAGRLLQPGQDCEVHLGGLSSPQALPAAESPRDTHSGHPAPGVPALTDDHFLFIDEYFLAVSKPAPLNMHAVRPGDTHHLVAAVQAWCLTHQLPLEPSGPFLSSRLDQETSGLVLLARTKDAGARLTRLFSDRLVHKRYLAIVQGHPPEEGRLEGPIGPAGQGRYRVRPDGQPATTLFCRLEQAPREASLEVEPLTGRTHQIRVHLSQAGFPLVGDLAYGGSRRPGASRCLLHAWRLELTHPYTGQSLRLEAPLPPDMLLSWRP